MAQFNLYVHKVGLEPLFSFHFCCVTETSLFFCSLFFSFNPFPEQPDEMQTIILSQRIASFVCAMRQVLYFESRYGCYTH